MEKFARKKPLFGYRTPQKPIFMARRPVVKDWENFDAVTWEMMKWKKQLNTNAIKWGDDWLDYVLISLIPVALSADVMLMFNSVVLGALAFMGFWPVSFLGYRLPEIRESLYDKIDRHQYKNAFFEEIEAHENAKKQNFEKE